MMYMMNINVKSCQTYNLPQTRRIHGNTRNTNTIIRRKETYAPLPDDSYTVSLNRVGEKST